MKLWSLLLCFALSCSPVFSAHNTQGGFGGPPNGAYNQQLGQNFGQRLNQGQFGQQQFPARNQNILPPQLHVQQQNFNNQGAPVGNFAHNSNQGTANQQGQGYLQVVHQQPYPTLNGLPQQIQRQFNQGPAYQQGQGFPQGEYQHSYPMMNGHPQHVQPYQGQGQVYTPQNSQYFSQQPSIQNNLMTPVDNGYVQQQQTGLNNDDTRVFLTTCLSALTNMMGVIVSQIPVQKAPQQQIQQTAHQNPQQTLIQQQLQYQQQVNQFQAHQDQLNITLAQNNIASPIETIGEPTKVTEAQIPVVVKTEALTEVKDTDEMSAPEIEEPRVACHDSTESFEHYVNDGSMGFGQSLQDFAESYIKELDGNTEHTESFSGGLQDKLPPPEDDGDYYVAQIAQNFDEQHLGVEQEDDVPMAIPLQASTVPRANLSNGSGVAEAITVQQKKASRAQKKKDTLSRRDSRVSKEKREKKTSLQVKKTKKAGEAKGSKKVTPTRKISAPTKTSGQPKTGPKAISSAELGDLAYTYERRDDHLSRLGKRRTQKEQAIAKINHLAHDDDSEEEPKKPAQKPRVNEAKRPKKAVPQMHPRGYRRSSSSHSNSDSEDHTRTNSRNRAAFIDGLGNGAVEEEFSSEKHNSLLADQDSEGSASLEEISPEKWKGVKRRRESSDENSGHSQKKIKS